MKEERKSEEQRIADAILDAVKDKKAKMHESKSGLIVVGEKKQEMPGQYL